MICLTWILCRAVEASATLCGTSKHLAVLILALTNHCWKSLSAARSLCSNKRSLFWHSLDARRLRLGSKKKNMNLASCSQIHCHWEPLPLTGDSVHKEREGLYPKEVFAVYCPRACQHKEDTWADAQILHILSSNYRGGGVRDMSTCEKQPGGEMAKWVKRKEWVLGQRERLGDGAKGYCVVGGWEATYEWGKSSQGWQDEENDGRQVDAVRKRVRWKGYWRDTVCEEEVTV